MKHSLVVRQLSNGIAVQGQLLQLRQLGQLLYITELADLVGMQVQHLQLGEPGHILLNAAQLALRQVQPAQLRLHTIEICHAASSQIDHKEYPQLAAVLLHKAVLLAKLPIAVCYTLSAQI